MTRINIKIHAVGDHGPSIDNCFALCTSLLTYLLSEYCLHFLKHSFEMCTGRMTLNLVAKDKE